MLKFFKQLLCLHSYKELSLYNISHIPDCYAKRMFIASRNSNYVLIQCKKCGKIKLHNILTPYFIERDP